MPVLLQARPMTGSVSFSLYSNNEDHRSEYFKRKGHRFKFSVVVEFMHLQFIIAHITS